MQPKQIDTKGGRILSVISVVGIVNNEQMEIEFIGEKKVTIQKDKQFLMLRLRPAYPIFMRVVEMANAQCAVF